MLSLGLGLADGTHLQEGLSLIASEPERRLEGGVDGLPAGAGHDLRPGDEADGRDDRLVIRRQTCQRGDGTLRRGRRVETGVVGTHGAG